MGGRRGLQSTMPRAGCCPKCTRTAPTLSNFNVSSLKIAGSLCTPYALCLYFFSAFFNLKEWFLKFLQNSLKCLPHILRSIWLDKVLRSVFFPSCLVCAMFLVNLVLLTFGVNAFAFASVCMVRLIAQSKLLRAV